MEVILILLLKGMRQSRSGRAFRQLAYFEKGYLERDVEILEEYCDSLVSKDNILILGTMPGEIF